MPVNSGWRNILKRVTDINCDLGEGMAQDELIMPYISSANIACGYHAGDVHTLYRTVGLATKHHVSVGAHVSWLDKENFGRTEKQLPPEEIYELVEQQLILLKEIADLFDTRIVHVKPHGALYNQSARDPDIAQAIARATMDFDRRLILFGLSGSHSVTEAKKLGLQARNEVFADRSYQDDGSLTPRAKQGAMLENTRDVVRQVLQMAEHGTVRTVSGKDIPVLADTICIHGDGARAAEFAKAVHDALRK
jgi:UPF0271 protein